MPLLLCQCVSLSVHTYDAKTDFFSPSRHLTTNKRSGRGHVVSKNVFYGLKQGWNECTIIDSEWKRYNVDDAPRMQQHLITDTSFSPVLKGQSGMNFITFYPPQGQDELSALLIYLIVLIWWLITSALVPFCRLRSHLFPLLISSLTSLAISDAASFHKHSFFFLSSLSALWQVH